MAGGDLDENDQGLLVLHSKCEFLPDNEKELPPMHIHVPTPYLLCFLGSNFGQGSK